jgi:predicted phage tail protein
VNKKTLITACFTSALLTSLIAGSLFVGLGKANPYWHESVYEGEMSPPDGTPPPTVIIFSPNNDTVYSSKNFSLIFNITIAQSYAGFPDIDRIYYQPSWQSSNVDVNPNRANSYSINFTDVPEGTYLLSVYAVQEGCVYTHEGVRQHRNAPDSIAHYYKTFKITGSSRVKFTIDVTPPQVSILSVQNKTYDTSDVQLDISVSETSLSKLSYVLDGEENVTIVEKTTLSGLSNGEHSVTVYATDEAGNAGVSETTAFSVDVPFPTTMVIAPAASLAFLGVGLAVYFKKRNHQKLTVEVK